MDTAAARRHRPLLLQGRWFAGLPEAHQQALLDAALVQTWPAGARLFCRGDANGGLHAVLRGAVQIAGPPAGAEAAREQLLGVLGPPQWFGEITCLDGGARTHDAHALVASTVLRVPWPALQALAEAEPLWWRHLGRLLAEKVRALFAGIEDLAQPDAAARVARRLLAMAEGHGMLAPGHARRSVQVSQAQLGAMLGLSRQTVSEVLGAWAQVGWVQRGYGRVDLLAPAALAALAQGLAAPDGASLRSTAPSGPAAAARPESAGR